MNKNYIYYTIITTIFLLTPTLLQAQFPEELSDRYIRVAEAGDLTDTLNVWGDVGSSGRYIVPEGIKLPELISFSLGFTQLRGR
ncbi:MAG TPA: hypothetical protein VK074_02595, partial [Fodinibius sp.]|nr:hypothetical protein [Fodinibius sp.]